MRRYRRVVRPRRCAAAGTASVVVAVSLGFLMSMPRAAEAGRRQADYFRQVLRHELLETHHRVVHLNACLSALRDRDEATITVKRTRRALASAVSNGHKVAGMLDALDRSYPQAPTAVAS